MNRPLIIAVCSANKQTNRKTRLQIRALSRVSIVVGVHVERLPSGLIDQEYLALHRSCVLLAINLGSYPRHTFYLLMKKSGVKARGGGGDIFGIGWVHDWDGRGVKEYIL